ncbi:MAG: hypothetical protein RLP44_04035 [Aggregatilineales bacterium]
MNPMRAIIFVVVLFIFSSLSFSTAQDTDTTCPALVEQAIRIVDAVCDDLGRNQACYGNVLVSATGEDATVLESFATSGDIVDVAQINRLTTAALDVDAETWGVAVLALQANLPDTLPGQNVLFVLYGDASIENDTENVDEELVDNLSSPMQAFRFSTGIGESTCEDVPQNGLMIQSPDETRVNFRANGVDIEIGSLILLQTPTEDTMSVAVIEGDATLTTQDGVVQNVGAGEQITIPTSPDGGEESNQSTNIPSSTQLGVDFPLFDLFDYTFSLANLPGSSDWLDTGVFFETGDAFITLAQGQVTVWPQCNEICNSDVLACDQLCPALTTGPAGSVPIDGIVPASSPFMLLPGAPIGALIGRIGTDGTPFVMSTENVAASSGNLFLRVNEDTRVYGDETGGYQVIIGKEN